MFGGRVNVVSSGEGQGNVYFIVRRTGPCRVCCRRSVLRRHSSVVKRCEVDWAAPDF